MSWDKHLSAKNDTPDEAMELALMVTQQREARVHQLAFQAKVIELQREGRLTQASVTVYTPCMTMRCGYASSIRRVHVH